MTRTRFVPLWCVALAVQIAWAGSSILHAQRVRGAPRIDEVRVIDLGQRQPNQLGVDGSGNVRIASSDELVRIDLAGSVELHPLVDLAVFGESRPVAQAISSDGTILAGFGQSDFAFYFEAMWWDVYAPSVAHGLGGDISEVNAVENTPSGLVMVGHFDGRPFDSRPDGGGFLPTLVPSQQGTARGVSADGSVYCGWQSEGFSHTAVRWVDRVPQALDQTVGSSSEAFGVSRDGANFAGQHDFKPVVWLAQDGLALRTLFDHDGAVFNGAAQGVLDDGFAFGDGSRDSQRFGWVWHPSFGTDSVMRFEDWLAQWNVGPIHVVGVRDVHATKRSFHFSLYGGPTRDSWYVQTPKHP